MKSITYFSVALAMTLQGCAPMVTPVESVDFAGSTFRLSIEKHGCVLGPGRYTDLSGKGNSMPALRFIALDASDNTVGEWYASCEAVVPNGSSICRINGPKRAHFECSNYAKYRTM